MLDYLQNLLALLLFKKRKLFDHAMLKQRIIFLLYYFAVPPTIRSDPPDGNYVVKKGRKVELKCIASGNPDPTITWTRQVSFG